MRARFVAVALVVTAVGCTPTGPYPFDIFAEMHYQASQRRLEPDRLAPPPGAVPVTGRSVAHTFEEAGQLQNPVRRTPETQPRARAVFDVNCAMCHGKDGRGQSVVAQRFQQAGQVPPVDFQGQRARSRSDGELYWLVTNGVGNMPPFGNLLAEEERWMVVNVIREVQGQ